MDSNNFETVFRLDCNAAENSSGYFDSPPEEVTIPYPYTFKLNRETMCYLLVKMDVWVRESHLRNIVTTFLNGTPVADTKATWNDEKENYLLKTTLGILEPGFHSISFETRWEREDDSVDCSRGEATDYWMLRSIEVIAHL